MTRFSALTTLLLGISAQAAVPTPGAGEASSTEYRPGEAVPLDEADLRDITLQVMQRSPLLSSAPGIKFATAQRSMRSTDIASVLYFPHSESAGVKQAFLVRCVRSVADKPWSCERPEIRRYLRLDSQNFEVRVMGAISTEGALALIDASREMARAKSPAGAPALETAVMISPDGFNSRYLVTWGTPEGYQELAFWAHLRGDANPARPESWELSVFDP